MATCIPRSNTRRPGRVPAQPALRTIIWALVLAPLLDTSASAQPRVVTALGKAKVQGKEVLSTMRRTAGGLGITGAVNEEQPSLAFALLARC
jgi:hypothetical protein